MNYKIIRKSDGAVVESCETMEKAQAQLFFYDTEENPHYIQKPNED